jgi:hypothetical protein
MMPELDPDLAELHAAVHVLVDVVSQVQPRSLRKQLVAAVAATTRPFPELLEELHTMRAVLKEERRHVAAQLERLEMLLAELRAHRAKPQDLQVEALFAPHRRQN